MIRYVRILERLKEAGYSSYKLQMDGLLSHSIMTKLRNNQPVGLTTIDTICRLTGCQPGELLEYVADNQAHK